MLSVFKIKYLFPFLISILLTGCCIYPTVPNNQDDKCELITKKLSLDMKVMEIPAEAMHSSNCNEPECALALIAVYPVSGIITGIVSGSIVVVGNSIHWLEQEGRCSDGVIKKAISGLTGSLVSAGGWIVDSKDDLIALIKGKKAK